jgi:hypothetical protein
MKRSLQLSVVIIFLVSCSKPLPDLDGVDEPVWKTDSKGCLGKRVVFLEALQGQRDKLKGLSEIDLVKLLGKPDRNDLSERHQKSYFYFIEPGPGCDNGKEDALKLIVRFNATGVSREVAIE